MELEIRHLSKTFNTSFAVKNISIVFKSNVISAIIGPNGAGKTTLLNLISTPLRPDEGAILYGGLNIEGLPPSKIADRGIGRLCQRPRVFKKLTALENVMAAAKIQKGENPLLALVRRKKISQEEARNMEIARRKLAAVGLSGKEGFLASSLSFGEQKLLSFAAFLLRSDCHCWLLDEVTAGINPVLLSSIINLIVNAAKTGKIVVMVEHNIGVIERVANMVYFMDNGEIKVQGNFSEVLNNPFIQKTYTGHKC